MPLPKNRSNSVRKIFVRTPKRGAVVHYKRREKGNAHSCSLCGCVLQAVASKQWMHKGAKTPNRKFGGALCSACASRVLVAASRVREGTLQQSEIGITALPYVKRLLAAKK